MVFGFFGVLVMLRPGAVAAESTQDWRILLLPIVAAFGYACMQILTRRLGVASKASAMAIYLQGTFIAVSLIDPPCLRQKLLQYCPTGLTSG